MISAAREHHVDDCEKEHGTALSPVIRNAILEGTPVAASDMRLLLDRGLDCSSQAAPPLSPPPVAVLLANIPRRCG
jgi:hypothetical protein